MKTKRRIRSIYNKLKTADRTDDIMLAQEILAWVLDEGEGAELFEEIVPTIEEPKSRLSANLYAYDQVQEVWWMPNPKNREQCFIAQTRPSYTPQGWWTKKPLDEIQEEVLFHEYYLGVVASNDQGRLDWTSVENCFVLYREMFRTRSQVEKFLSHYYPIDFQSQVLVGEKDRQTIAESTGLKTTALREEIELTFDADWVYTYKKDGERIWAMKLRDHENED